LENKVRSHRTQQRGDEKLENKKNKLIAKEELNYSPS
jgi:hypothetical protein